MSLYIYLSHSLSLSVSLSLYIYIYIHMLHRSLQAANKQSGARRHQIGRGKQTPGSLIKAMKIHKYIDMCTCIL